MLFQGLNSRTAKTDLADGDSPSLANCFFAAGKVGTLGPRRGRYVVNSGVYADGVSGRMLFRLPNGTSRQVLALNNGQVLEGARSGQNGPTLYLTGNTATGIGQDGDLTLSYPSVSGSVLTLFDDASTFAPDSSLLASWGITPAAVGNADWSDAKQLNIGLGINENGVGRILVTLKISINWEGAWGLQGATPAALHSGRDTITGGYFTLEWPDGWPAGSGAGDSFSITGLLIG